MLLMTHGASITVAAGGGATNTYGTNPIAPFTGGSGTHAGLHILLTDTTVDPSLADPNVILGVDYGVMDVATGSTADGIGIDDYIATDPAFGHSNAEIYGNIGIGQSAIKGQINISATAEYEYRILVIGPSNTGKNSVKAAIISDTASLWDGNNFIFDGGSPLQPLEVQVSTTGTNAAMFRGTLRNPAHSTGSFIMEIGFDGSPASTRTDEPSSVVAGSGTPQYADSVYLKVNIV